MVYALIRMIHFLRILNLSAEKVFTFLAAVLILGMLILVNCSVAARFLSISTPWAEASMLILLPSLAFVVAPIAYRRAGNVALNITRDALPIFLRGVHGLLLHLLILVILLVGLDLTLRKIGVDPGWLSVVIQTLVSVDLSVIRPFATPMRIPALGILLRDVYTVMPISMVVLILVNFELILRHLIVIWRPDHEAMLEVRPIDQVHADGPESSEISSDSRS